MTDYTRQQIWKSVQTKQTETETNRNITKSKNKNKCYKPNLESGQKNFSGFLMNLEATFEDLF